MTTDFEVAIRYDTTGTNLVVSLTASDPTLNINEMEFLRAVATGIAENNMTDLRSGNPNEQTVKDVAKKLSDWLIASDMQGFIHSPVLGNGPIRFIFKLQQRVLETL